MGDHQLRADNYFAVIPEWVIDMEAVTDQAFRVYSLMQRYSNSETGEVFPAVGTLAKRLHRSDRSVQRALRELEGLGLIERIEPTSERVTYTYLLRTTPLTNVAGGGDDSATSRGDKSDTLSREVLTTEGTSTHEQETLTLTQHMFEEMVNAWFRRSYEELENILTKTQRQRINAAIAELQAIGVDKGEITFVAHQYRAKWPDMELTPQALTKHWHNFSEEAVNAAKAEHEAANHKHTFELADASDGYRYVCTDCGEMGPLLGVVNGGG